MSRLLVHDQTRQSLDGVKSAPPHALLLVGPVGVGKLSVARALLEEVLQTDGQNYDDYPYAVVIAPEEGKNSIGVDSIRELEQLLGLKVPRKKPFNRGIVIENADLMTQEAQNAVLKTLEEPPSDTVIVLTASHQRALLPTIVSRTQSVNIQRPDKTTVIDHFSDKANAAELEKAYAISAGLPGLMNSLLEDEEHPLKSATENARRLLGQTTYERLLTVDALAKDKQLAADTAYIIQQMAHVSLQTAQGPSANKWRSVLRASHEASEALRSNGQPKLVLTNLMLEL